MTSSHTTEAPKRIRKVVLGLGFDRVEITLDRVAGGFVVGVAQLYVTHIGERVQGVKEKPFTSEADARAYANRTWARYRRQGYQPPGTGAVRRRGRRGRRPR